MIEAQSKYISGQIGEVLAARTAGKSLAITPRDARVAAFNKEIQGELNASSFADPNCNSWYKRKDNGRITQNWSRNVVDYQKVSLCQSDRLPGCWAACGLLVVVGVGLLTRSSRC